MAQNETQKVIEERKVKVTRKDSFNSLEQLTLWFEEIDKDEWGPRMEWYLSLWKEKYIGKDEE